LRPLDQISEGELIAWGVLFVIGLAMVSGLIAYAVTKAVQ
jgi:hypothetical protein